MLAVARRWTVLTAALAMAALVWAAVPAEADHEAPEELPPVAETRRLAGPGRYDTARLIAEDAFPDGTGTVVLARGDAFPDALASAYLAGQRGAAVLLTEQDALPTPTADGLEALGPENVIVLGGEGAVGPGVVSVLESRGYTVERIGGADRYETALRVAEAGETIGTLGAEPVPVPRRTVILATGEGFADALAAGPLAFAGALPILLTPSATLSPHAQAFLEDEERAVEQVLIVGGESAVSAEVAAEVAALGKEVVRVAGEDRTETAALLAERTAAALEWEFAEVNLAAGGGFADALAMAPRAGVSMSVLVLTQTVDTVGPHTGGLLATHCADLATIVVAGGTAVVSEDGATDAAQAATCRIPATLELDPAESSAPVNTTHAVVATLTDQFGDPVVGINVQFEVYRGDPPALAAGQPGAESDENGQVRFEYTHDAEGVDRILACAPQGPITACDLEHEQRPAMPYAEAQHTWTAAPA